jgi:NitT/TauT family transport system permease protein
MTMKTMKTTRIVNRRGRALLGQVLPPVVVLAAATLLTEFIVRMGDVPAYLLPPPSQVLMVFVKRGNELFAALGYTTLAAAIGFALSAVVGIGLAIVLSSSTWVRRAFYPYAVFFQTVPVVAVAPLLVVWFDFGLRPVVAAVFIVSIFPVIAATLAGLRATDPALVDLFRLYGSGPFTRLWKLRLPAALPSIFTGLRVAAGLAVIGAIIGDLFSGTFDAAKGLGIFLQQEQRQMHTDAVFAIILAAALLGLALFILVGAASHLTLRRWHPGENG